MFEWTQGPQEKQWVIQWEMKSAWQKKKNAKKPWKSNNGSKTWKEWAGIPWRKGKKSKVSQKNQNSVSA